MEEILTLKSLLLQGNITEALAIVEELEEMSREDKINNIRSYAKVLLLHLIKQKAEDRTTRSWDVSIRNCVREIQLKNKRRKSGGSYVTSEELRLVFEEAYPSALDNASLEVEEGRYEVEELKSKIDQNVIINHALNLIA